MTISGETGGLEDYNKVLSTRIVSSIFGIALVSFVVFSGTTALGIGIFVLSIIGLYEFYSIAEKKGYRPVKFVGYLSCFSILFLGMKGEANLIKHYIPIVGIPDFRLTYYFCFGVYIIILILLMASIFFKHKYNFVDISITTFGMLYVTFLFSFIVLTRNLEFGKLFIWLIFISAWATDSSAYFIGRAMGKHKLIPSVSPKKTVEGAIAGVCGCMLAAGLFGSYIVTNFAHITVPHFHYVIIGLLNGIFSQMGDLAASSIKRFADVKDYGKIIPGHGGVLDRFDSTLLIAPTVYFYITMLLK